ncbi:MAG: SUMF1/EgtB/PvdO family nonheme iron enzyme [Gammaproteobacteria bacterium]|nr:SUMF1/EgtB/PvdO family nonheme iron enzyme [Gammaproteobacteria bacterium]
MTEQPRLPFAGFIAHLQRLGFIIGVEHHLRLHAVLNLLGPQHSPEDLKTLLCPLFATDKERQRQFHAAFDSFFKHWHVKTPAAAEQSEAARPRAVKRKRTWKILTAVLLWLAAAGLGYRAYEHAVTPPVVIRPPPVPIKTSPPPEQRPELKIPIRRVLRPAQILKKEDKKQSLFERYWETLRPLLIGLPLLIWLLWELRAWQRRRLAVMRRHGRKPPVSWPLRITAPTLAFLRAEGFYDTARALRRRIAGEHLRLDIDETVRRNVERLGHIELYYKPVRQVPEYLILIDLPCGRDHQAHLADTLVNTLQEEEVHLHRYFYRGNPRICFEEPGGERTYLHDLQARYGKHRLIVIGEGEKFRDPMSGDPEEWMEFFRAWPYRALLTPRPPAQWGAREAALAREFTVLAAAGTVGLGAAVTRFEEERGDSLAAWKRRDIIPPLPLLQQEEPGSGAVAQLRAWLVGDDLFRWLCACAVYPELHWDLTLHLAGLFPAGLLNEANLQKMLRLPWFRAGTMPDGWRLALLRELDRETVQAVRAALIELLEQDPPPAGSVAEQEHCLQLAVQRWFFLRLNRGSADHPVGRFFKRGAGIFRNLKEYRARRRELKDALRVNPVVRDYALLRLLEGTPSPLALLLPQRMRRFFFRSGVPLLGVRGGIRAGLAFFICLLLWFFLPIIDPPPPVSEKWERAEPVADLSNVEPGTVFREQLSGGNGYAPEMVFIPAGTFRMGSPDSEEGRDSDEGPVHEVNVNAFAIGRYEVTFEEYDRFCDISGQKKPDDAGWGRGRHPVINVSSGDAAVYAKWLNEQTGYVYRLPTEAEWEYAARAGKNTAYHFGDDEKLLDEYDWYSANSDEKTHPVGEKKLNAWQLYDMHGNVWEWVQDWHAKDYYANSPKDNPTGPETGIIQVFRGGGWSVSLRYVRSANRSGITSGYRRNDVGFRLVRANALYSYPSPKLPHAPKYFKDSLKDGGQAPEMVAIRGDTFRMGDVWGEDDEKPAHDVTLGNFSIGRYEVTFEEYDLFCEKNGREKPDDRGWGRGKRPVINVYWKDAMAYAEWVSEQTGEKYRLPTEAEWEYAARAGTETAYWWGKKASHEYANYGKNKCCEGLAQGKDQWENTAPVGSFAANPFGLHDTAGNVYEWVRDWYDAEYYGKSPTENPSGPETGIDRVIRGGGWFYPSHYVRSTFRNRGIPGSRYAYVGFRLARTYPRPSFTLPEMIPIPGGMFRMGDIQGGGDSDEKPVHEVTLDRFSIGKYEVKRGEFQQFAEAEKYVTEAKERKGCWGYKDGKRGWHKELNWRNPGFEQTDEHPAVCVSWNDAVAYIAWLNKMSGEEYRLLTEAEWEYAARAGKETAYWWGNEVSHEYANYGKDECCAGLAQGKDQWENTAPVSSFAANPFGVYDTSGNVYEWVQDLYGGYSKKAQSNPGGPKSGAGRVIRGGSWDDSPHSVRSAGRGGDDPGIRDDRVGFRLARTYARPSFTLPEMIPIPGGTFRIGDIQGGGDSDEKPVHEVTLGKFSVGKYEVKKGEFRQFADVAGYTTEAEKEKGCRTYKKGKWNWHKELNWRNPGFEQTDEHPAVCVSWNDASAYIAWLNDISGKQYRLPTEAEWEYAARAGSDTKYWWGNEASHEYANYGRDECCGGFVLGKDQWEKTAPAGSFPQNPFGLYDTAGNVDEWIQDWYGKDYYANSPKKNPIGPDTGEIRAVRGGGWSAVPYFIRSTIRGKDMPSNRTVNLGFRIANTLPPVTISARPTGHSCWQGVSVRYSKARTFILAMGANTDGVRMANKDARAFAKGISSRFKVPSAHTCVLTDIWRSQFRDSLKRLKTLTKSNDRAFIYFSGHGTYLEEGRYNRDEADCLDEALVTKYKKDPSTESVRDDLLVKWINALPVTPQNRVVFLDTGFASSMRGGSKDTGSASSMRGGSKDTGSVSSMRGGRKACPGVTEKWLKYPGMPLDKKAFRHGKACPERNKNLHHIKAAFYAASKEGQSAWEVSGKGGRFTYTFLEKLKRYKKGKRLTLADFNAVFNKASATIRAATKKTRCEQHPARFAHPFTR